MKSRSLLVAVLLLIPLLSAWPAVADRDDPSKTPDARQTTEAFLAAALAGRTKEAAALGEPGKSPSREKTIKKFERFNVFGKELALVRVLADDQKALAITEKVVDTKSNREGPISIRLIKKDKHWLIYDIDVGTEQATGNLERFQREQPNAKDVPRKKGK